MNLNPGSMIAGMILPKGNLVYTVTGYPLTASATANLQKTTSSNNTPRLVQ